MFERYNMYALIKARRFRMLYNETGSDLIKALADYYEAISDRRSHLFNISKEITIKQAAGKSITYHADNKEK